MLRLTSQNLNIMNKVQIIGRAGANPQIELMPNGDKLAKLSLAIHEKAFSKKSSNVHWQRVIAWGRKAELMERYIKKGQLLHVEGKMTNKAIERNGQPMKISEILCQNFLMINPKTPKA